MPTSPLVDNSTLTSEPIASLGVELLTRSIVLPATVSRVSSTDYRGSGGTTHVRVRVPRVAREQSVPGTIIEFDDVIEHSIPVALRHAYDAALLSDEELSYSLEQFGEQVLAPQIESVATFAENVIAAELNAIAPTIPTVSEPSRAVLEARQWLTENNVPMGRRWLACSPSFATELLDEDRITLADQSGSSSALRDAMIGRLFGFNVIESAAIADGQAVAYHQSAFAAAWMAPVRPRGAAYSTVASSGGVSVRHVLDYIADRLSEASIVSVFVGAGTILDDDGQGEQAEDSVRAVGLSLLGSV